MKITLPKRFKDIIQESRYEGVVNTAIVNYSDLLRESRFYFFPEYTNHGIEHINDILLSTEKLISEKTFEEKILTGDDICFYILAVIIHDIGMHITYDGFITLINHPNDKVIIPKLDKKPWRELWNEYFHEVKRFSGDKLKSIFNDNDIIIRNPLEVDINYFDEKDKKVIGEFIRRHHPRLAQEIALSGFPGIDGKRIPLTPDIPSVKRKNLIGFIARSHGMGLRESTKYLDLEYGVKAKILNINATYLMILLRISDYLQIDSSRTSTFIQSTKKITSPVSKLEHDAHLSVDAVQYGYEQDLERIFVHTDPKDSIMYLKLKRLFENIQYEMDVSLAVIEELYREEKTKPDLRYKRITSDLDKENVVNNFSFIPDKFSFNSNPELLKLLISPLYGDDPAYGLRELLMNSVDACLERKELEESNNDYFPKIKVDIFLRDNKYYFRITDNGIGMNPMIIKNYFLTAGASLRENINWKKKFINDDNEVIVQRNGRFGIGVLASFLIGSKIEVNTKPFGSDQGYSFKAHIYENQINIKKNDEIPTGTSILIETTKNKIDKLVDNNAGRPNWTDWYILSNIDINYTLFGEEINCSYKEKIPHYLDAKSKDWNYVDVTGYDKIMWSYNSNYYNMALAVNGFIVNNSSYHRSLENCFDSKLINSKPSILIFDSKGITPISLDRKGLNTKAPFTNELLTSVYKDYIAYLLAHKFSNDFENNIVSGKDFFLNYNGFYKRNGVLRTNMLMDKYMGLVKLLVSRDGYIPDYDYFLFKNIHNRLISINIKSKDSSFSPSVFLSRIKTIKIPEKSFVSFSKGVFKGSRLFPNLEKIIDEGKKHNYRIIAAHGLTRHYIKTELLKETPQRLLIEEKIGKRVYISINNPNETEMVKERLIDISSGIPINAITESRIDMHLKDDVQDPILIELLEYYFGDCGLIPIDFEERKKKFPKAFEELDQYIKKYI